MPPSASAAAVATDAGMVASSAAIAMAMRGGISISSKPKTTPSTSPSLPSATATTPTFAYSPVSTRRVRTNNDETTTPNEISSSILQNHHHHHHHQKRHQEAMNSILDLLEQLQQSCALNDDQQQPPKEFAIRHYPNGDLFSGNVDASTKELLYGRMTYALDMEVYEGPFWRGDRHGPGAMCYKMDGSAKFLGRYHEGQMHSGTLISSEYTYTGTFLNNNFHGIGTMVSQKGSIYQGQFVHGKYHGVGVLRTVMVHPLYHDDEDDEGIDFSSNAECVYTGDFVDGSFSGFGTLITQSANGLPSFVGTWSEGKRVEGIESLPNGDIYEGRFVNELREGPGMLTVKSSGRPSMTKGGIWEGGLLKEDVDMNVEFENGNCYFGEHVNSVPHGFGKMEYADTGSGKSSYIGSFVNGVRHGEGRCVFHKTGEVYEGEWQADEPIGLKIFQYEGPHVEGGAPGQDNMSETMESSPRPPTDQPRRCSNTSMLSNDDELSVDEGDNPSTATDPPTTALFRRQSTSSDNLSQTMKSLLVFDNSEEPTIKKYQYQNGDVYEGCLDEVTGLRQGSGIYTEHRMGSSYNGDWKQSKRHGTGHLKLVSGVEYYGEFHDDMVHGEGHMILINESEYTGSFVNGLFHGHGVLEEFEQSRVYIGEFEDGERAGEGEETLSDGSKFKGTYQHGKRNGFGILYGPDNSVIYRGEWKDGLQHGRGLLYCRELDEELHRDSNINDGVYDGEFLNSKFSGSGKFTYNDRTIIEGKWLDGRPIDGDWTITYPEDGKKYYGFATFRVPSEKLRASVRSFSRGLTAASQHELLRVPLPHGFGSLLFPNGRRDVGSFVYGEKDAAYQC